MVIAVFSTRGHEKSHLYGNIHVFRGKAAFSWKVRFFMEKCGIPVKYLLHAPRGGKDSYYNAFLKVLRYPYAEKAHFLLEFQEKVEFHLKTEFP